MWMNQQDKYFQRKRVMEVGGQDLSLKTQTHCEWKSVMVAEIVQRNAGEKPWKNREL